MNIERKDWYTIFIMRKVSVVLVLTIFLTLSAYGGMVARADASLIIIGNKGTYVYTRPEIESYLGELYLKNRSEILKGICDSERVFPLDAKLRFFPNRENKFKLKKEVFGLEVDLEKLNSDVTDALFVGGGTVFLSYKTIKPKITITDLEGITKLRGSFSTQFLNQEDRIKNITLAAKRINGCIIEKGKIFSFNEVVGARTEARGYKMAKIILNGEFVEGVGGGVCQVSTTLYNSALVSGLEIIEHHRHSLFVNYIEKSFDAMVNSSSSDLKFKNNTNSPIFISANISKNSLTFNIYGEENPYHIVRESVITEVIEPETKFVESELLKKGETKVVIAPKNGYKSEGYLRIYKGNRLIMRKKLRIDSYFAVNGITEVGINDVE